MFLCKTEQVDLKWFKKDIVPKDVLEAYTTKINSETVTTKTCNTDKSKFFTCNMKCKTRGLQLACGNCGIVLAFRELFGSESCTQVAQMYIDLCEAYKG